MHNSANCILNLLDFDMQMVEMNKHFNAFAINLIWFISKYILYAY